MISFFILRILTDSGIFGMFQNEIAISKVQTSKLFLRRVRDKKKYSKDHFPPEKRGGGYEPYRPSPSIISLTESWSFPLNFSSPRLLLFLVAFNDDFTYVWLPRSPQPRETNKKRPWEQQPSCFIFSPINPERGKNRETKVPTEQNCGKKIRNDFSL